MKIPGYLNLVEKLAEITEKKPEVSAISDIEIIQEEKPKPNPDDFDYSNLNNISDIAPEPTEPIQQPDPAELEKPVSFAEYKEEALAMVRVFDGLISSPILAYLYRRKLMSYDEYMTAKDLMKRIRRNKDAETSFTEAEFDLYQKLLDLDDFKETLPIDEKEEEQLAQPLAELMQKWGKKTSPEGRLAFAILSIYGLKAMVLVR
jgi:hypothetical protein